MSDIESRLTNAMAERADEVEPKDEDEALSRISQRVTVSRRRGFTILGIAAGLAIVVGAVALLNRGDDKKQHVNVASGSNNSTNTTASTANSTSASVIPSDGPTPIWPFASSSQTFATPEDAAKSFAVDYLGMTNALVGKAVGRDVPVFPNSTGSERTVVHAEQRGSNWVVVGADADEISVDTPKPNDPLASSVTVSGKSVAFEAQLGVQLRPFGSTTPTFTGTAMGGSTDVQPFSTTIAPPATDQPLVLVIFEGDASGRGAVTKATVIPLTAAGSPEPTTFVGQSTNGDLTLLDFAGHVQRPATASDESALQSPTTLPSNENGSLASTRGRFGTIVYFDGEFIKSYNPATGATVKLLPSPNQAAIISLDADASGRYLLFVDANHDLWKWSGGEPMKVGTGFNSAAW